MFMFNFQGPLIHKWAQPLTGTLHMQHVIMRAQYGCPKCMRTTATWHSPKIKVYEGAQEGISLHHTWKKFWRSQGCLETSVRDRWENHSLPAKGPGVLVSDIKVVHTGLAVSKGCVQKQIGKGYAYSCFFLESQHMPVSNTGQLTAKPKGCNIWCP